MDGDGLIPGERGRETGKKGIRLWSRRSDKGLRGGLWTGRLSVTHDGVTEGGRGGGPHTPTLHVI